MASSGIVEIRREIEFQANVESEKIQGGEKMYDWYLKRVKQLHGRSHRVAKRLLLAERKKRMQEALSKTSDYQWAC